MASNLQPNGFGAEPAETTSSPQQMSSEPSRSSVIRGQTGTTQVPHDDTRPPRPLPSPPPPPFERPPPRAPFSTKLRHCKQMFWRLIRMAWLDFLVILIVLGITGAVLKWAPLLKQNERKFPVFQDSRSGLWKGPYWLSYPLYMEPEENIVIDQLPNVPRFMVPILPLSFILPVALGLVLLLMQIWIRSLWDKLAGLLGLYKTLSFISLIQVCLKKFIGEFRPNFIEICNPNWDNIVNKTKILVEGQVWGQVSDCKAWKGHKPSPKLTHAMESFPSGHTSECFAAATFLALYLNGKLKPFSDYHTSFWKMILVISPLFASSFVAGSLLIDHNHHPHDILLSIPIGVFVALLTYRSHYASLFNYRTNHLYLPFSSSHRSLDKTPQESIDLSSDYDTSRFRYYDNMAAVAWPRKPQRHNFTVQGERSEPGIHRNGGRGSGRTGAAFGGGHDGARDSRGEDAGGNSSAAVRGRRPLSSSNRRPRPVRGILKNSRARTSSETIPEEDESAVEGVRQSGTMVRTGGESSSSADAATVAAQDGSALPSDDDSGSVRRRSGEDRLSVSEMV